MKTIGERIKQARDELGWSGLYLANKVGYKTQSGISNLEQRATGSGGNKITKIAQALNVPLDWLMNGPDADKVPFLSPPTEDAHAVNEPGVMYLPARDDKLKVELLTLWGQLNENHKREWIGDLRRFVREKGPHHVGADPALAEK